MLEESELREIFRRYFPPSAVPANCKNPRDFNKILEALVEEVVSGIPNYSDKNIPEICNLFINIFSCSEWKGYSDVYLALFEDANYHNSDIQVLILSQVKYLLLEAVGANGASFLKDRRDKSEFIFRFFRRVFAFPDDIEQAFSFISDVKENNDGVKGTGLNDLHYEIYPGEVKLICDGDGTWEEEDWILYYVKLEVFERMLHNWKDTITNINKLNFET